MNKEDLQLKQDYKCGVYNDRLLRPYDHFVAKT